MKKVISLLVFLVASVSVYGADTTALPAGVYGQGYEFRVTDPATFMAALETYRQSPTSQAYNSSVSLLQLVAKGHNAATHRINVFYPTLEDMNKAVVANASSADWRDFLTSLGQSSTNLGSNLFSYEQGLANQPEITNGVNVNYLYGLEVSNVAEYQKAMEKVLSSSDAAAFPGNMAMGQNMAMGETKSTHWVNFTAKDMGTLIAGMKQFMGSKTFQDYGKNAASFRRIDNREVNQQLKRWVAN